MRFQHLVINGLHVLCSYSPRNQSNCLPKFSDQCRPYCQLYCLFQFHLQGHFYHNNCKKYSDFLQCKVLVFFGHFLFFVQLRKHFFAVAITQYSGSQVSISFVSSIIATQESTFPQLPFVSHHMPTNPAYVHKKTLRIEWLMS